MCNSQRRLRPTNEKRNDILLSNNATEQLSLRSFMKDLLRSSTRDHQDELVIVDDNAKAPKDMSTSSSHTIDSMERQNKLGYSPLVSSPNRLSTARVTPPPSYTRKKPLCRWDSGGGSPSACSRNAKAGLCLPVRRRHTEEAGDNGCVDGKQRCLRRMAVALPCGLLQRPHQLEINAEDLTSRETLSFLHVILCLQQDGNLDGATSSEEFSVR